jgi:hypothetical protein
MEELLLNIACIVAGVAILIIFVGTIIECLIYYFIDGEFCSGGLCLFIGFWLLVIDLIYTLLVIPIFYLFVI